MEKEYEELMKDIEEDLNSDAVVKIIIEKKFLREF